MDSVQNQDCSISGTAALPFQKKRKQAPQKCGQAKKRKKYILFSDPYFLA